MNTQFQRTAIAAIGGGIALAAWLWASNAVAQTGVEYQNRGDRYEGVRSRPISVPDVELISALVDYHESARSLPDQLRVRFFLEENAPVHLTVRELEVKQYYWLDRAQPSRPWNRGFANEFVWSTATVLQKLPQAVVTSDLGAVARIDRAEPSADERVAPVIMYHTQPPTAVNGYAFAFKTSADARVSYAIYPDGKDAPIVTGAPLRPRGGRPFAVVWDASKAAPGRYRAVLDGYMLDTNQRLHQTVRFAHQPAISEQSLPPLRE